MREGKRSSFLMFIVVPIVFVLSTLANAATVNLAWDYPVGEEIHIEGYRLYYGKESHVSVVRPTHPDAIHYEDVIEIPNTSSRSFSIELPPGDWYFRMTAYRGSNVSDFGNEVFALVPFAKVTIVGIDVILHTSETTIEAK